MEKTVHLLIMYTMLVLTLLLFHKGRKHPRSLMLAIFASVEVLTNGLNSLTLSAGPDFFPRFPFSHFIYKPLYCLWVPLFYFYVRYSFSSDFKLNRKHLIHLSPFFAFLIFFLIIWMAKGNQYIHDNLYIKNSFVYNSAFAVDATVAIQYLFYNLLMISSLFIIENKNKLNQNSFSYLAVNIKWLRFIVFGYAIASFGGIGSFVAKLLGSFAQSTINMVSITYFFLFFFVIFYDTITHKPFTEEAPEKHLPNSGKVGQK